VYVSLLTTHGVIVITEELKSICSPDLEYLTIKCRPYFLPREFSLVVVTAVYIPPQANTMTALKELHCTLFKLETTYPEVAFIVSGDFNSKFEENTTEVLSTH
jgi:hypothetical protein